MFLILMAGLSGVHRLAPGKLKTGALRVLARHIGALEHGLRCLLLLMRAAPAPSLKVPEGLARAPSRRVRRRTPRFSLSLSALAEGFARHGHETSALKSSRAANPAPPPPRGPTASAPLADPADALLARLEAMRAVFADPHGHAAKFAAILRGRGLALRALKSLIPAAALWILTNHTGPVARHALRAPAPNTS